MELYYEISEGIICHGHALDVLRSMDSESVQMCVTSPPYWGLRDYGLPPMVWDAQEGCEHEWGDELPPRGQSGWHTFEHKYHSPGSHKTTIGSKMKKTQDSQNKGHGQFCQLCGAWFGNLGLEPTPELYISHMVQIFRELKRVLRNDGTLWLNMGDSYVGGGRAGYSGNAYGGLEANRKKTADRIYGPPTGKIEGMKPKDLCGIPWILAFALRADGWFLRSAMPWVKRSAMPESATDRPSSALEYMFLLTKNSKYYFDMDAIRVDSQASEKTINRAKYGRYDADTGQAKRDYRTGKPDFLQKIGNDYGGQQRNFRNTDLFFESLKEPYGMIFCGDEMVGIDCNPQAMKEAHFATFAQKLITPCILSGSSERGACPDCLAPWARVIDKAVPELRDVESEYPGEHTIATRKYKHDESGPGSKTIGWKPSCGCYGTEPLSEIPKKDDDEGDSFYLARIAPILQERFNFLESWKPLKTIPCVVADIFGGSMTTAVVSHKHGRKFIMIELSKEYIDEIGIPRIEKATKQKGWNRFK